MLAFLRSLDPLRVASVCTGALILGAAGLLDGRPPQPGAAPSPGWRDRWPLTGAAEEIGSPALPKPPAVSSRIPNAGPAL